MFRTTGNQKMSIMLVLSITILAAVLVTGTVVNIVTAANSDVKVQPKTYQHPVTSTGRSRIVSSTPHGNLNSKSNPGAVGPFTRSHTATMHLLKCTMFTCHCYTSYRGQMTYLQDCPVEITDMYTHTSTDGYKFDVGGKLYSCRGNVDNAPTMCTAGGQSMSLYPLANAPIELKVQQGDDKHAWYTPGIVHSSADATFNYGFSLCDDPKYSNHNAYPLWYFHAGSVSGDSYYEKQEYGPVFTLKSCPSPHFTDMHIKSNPNYNITFSGKLIDQYSLPVEGANVYFTANYLDNKPGHGHGFNCYTISRGEPKNPTCMQQGVTSKQPGSGYLTVRSTTKADGTFSNSFAACDVSIYVRPGGGYTSYAQLTAEFNGGTLPGPLQIHYLPATGMWDTFTTEPCSWQWSSKPIP
jgi:hypothetical protein